MVIDLKNLFTLESNRYIIQFLLNEVVKMIGHYCKKFRVSKLITLKELGGEEQLQNLHAFEKGRSSNIAHLVKYIELAIMSDSEYEFLDGLVETIKNNKEGN